MYQIASCVREIHGHNFIHRCLSPENFLVKNYENDSPEHPKIAINDFSFAINADSANINNSYGVLNYRSPEINEKAILNKQSDMYSVGAIMYVMAFKKIPNPQNISNDGLSEEGRNLLISLLSDEPSERPTAIELLNHPWFDSVRDQLKPTLASYI